MRLLPRFLALLICIAAAATATAQDELYLKITQPGLTRVSVATPAFLVLPGTPADVAQQFQKVLDADLAVAAPIAVLDPKLYSLVQDDSRPKVLYERWRSIGAQFLLTGTVVRAGGQLVVEARLVDLVSGEYAFAKRYRAGLNAADILAHTLANDLVKVFTGRPGPFLSRIAFISDRTGHSELWLMNWDGSDPRQLTKHSSIAIGPAWSPDGTKIAFTSYLRNTPGLYLLTPQEGYLKPLWDKGGVNSSPSFSPDGTKIAFASSVNENVDIWVIPTAGGQATRVTTARAIDTQPAWAPNGRQIVFTSARSGTPQLYIMDSDGANVRRLTFDGDFFDEAAWSPDGTHVACTTKVNGRFQLATIDIATDEVTILHGPGNNESPCFSPDGSLLAFSSDRDGSQQIYITDAEGRPHQLTHQGRNYSPTWGGMTVSR
ncbi:MAG: Tol-Pal system beta propeller repeat protein TolB [Acidobacteria bacterium]|jgi:TolB protein|nr:Tol-Pal system beta propeller repeat protein TolB [Acidobacteriota bacterium]